MHEYLLIFDFIKHIIWYIKGGWETNIRNNFSMNEGELTSLTHYHLFILIYVHNLRVLKGVDKLMELDYYNQPNHFYSGNEFQERNKNDNFALSECLCALPWYILYTICLLNFQNKINLYSTTTWQSHIMSAWNSHHECVSLPMFFTFSFRLEKQDEKWIYFDPFTLQSSWFMV